MRDNTKRDGSRRLLWAESFTGHVPFSETLGAMASAEWPRERYDADAIQFVFTFAGAGNDADAPPGSEIVCHARSRATGARVRGVTLTSWLTDNAH
jgi:hypothetical protein